MRRSLGREGQTEPLAALVAVAVVALALAVFAGAFETALPDQSDRDVAQDAADRVERAMSSGGVIRLDRATTAGPLVDIDGEDDSDGKSDGTSESDDWVDDTAPDGYHLNVTVRVDGDTYSFGPPAPDTADIASRRVSVGRGGGFVEPGRLEVRVWP